MNYSNHKSATNRALERQPQKANAKNTLTVYAFRGHGEVQDLVCFSYLRWDFVYQPPQHLPSRASNPWRVWYVEEPVWADPLRLEIRPVTDCIRGVVTHLPHDADEQTLVAWPRHAADQLLEQELFTDFIAWYYTRMALPFPDYRQAHLTVDDYMDPLSAFASVSASLLTQAVSLM